MDTCRDLIRRALRMIGAIATGSEPDTAEGLDSLEALQSLIVSLPAIGQGSTWRDVDVIADYTAGEDQRVRITTTDPVSITLPESVPYPINGLFDVDPLTWTGRVRPPRDGARVQIIGTQAALYLYRSDTAQWLQADDLALSDPIPFTAALHQGLAALVAVAMAPEFGAEAPPTVVAISQRARSEINARLSASRPVGIDRSAPWARLNTNYMGHP